MKRPGQFYHYLGGVAAGVLHCVPLAAQDVELGLEVEEMVVTGSRIRSSDVVAPSPVTVLTAEAIFETGLVDLSEVLRTVPALNSSLTASQSALTGADNGVAELDLRGLGANRTLVLVNGRRHVSGVDGEATVDIQTIPIALIESTEVLTGGGSAIYGADAVSGVVNFILKDDFEGFDYRGNFSFDDNGEACGYFAAVTVGSNFADGRGNSVLNVEYTRQDSIIGSDRPFAGSGLFSIVPNTGLVPETFGVDPAFDNTFVPNQTLPISSQFGIINFQGSAFGGVLDLLDGEITFGGLPIVQVVDETGTLRPFDPGIFADGFNASGGDGIATEEPAERIIPDIQRVVVNGNARFRFADFITSFLETKFAFTSTEDALGVNGFNDDIPILLDNPFIPQPFKIKFNNCKTRA
ncbi:MAG: TonB-dependent receptor plug domain-containing protein [Rhodothalassiaceae bacterium]